MNLWPPLLLHLGILMLSAEQGSTTEQSPMPGDKMVSAIVDVSHTLKCFAEIQESSLQQSRDAMRDFADILKASLRAHDDAVGDLLRRSQQLHVDDCAPSLANFSDAVAKITQDITDLTAKLADKDQKVVTLSNANKDLNSQLEDKDQKFKTFLLSVGYEHYPGFGFYKYFPQAQTWDAAAQNCRRWGSRLGIVNSRDEARVYATILVHHPLIEGAINKNYFHSGYKEVGNTRSFRTLDGDSLFEAGYTEWNSGEPNSADEQCGSINHDVKLNDVPCDVKFAYICEQEYP